ncbi:hypothetical protein G6F70_004728 [Rhizopus microsporus]|nr:hypothetical protein G6F71_008986 [Rhizopus microsporus]KAG1199675.1 hypothetical protein G6F70_004728 [Rhizopus microsporus]KAG1207599.1 hypothetical protein G6F69_007916 [Rhizopus microsporus]KAG1233337.1 hypothetical protein G6F67_004356 [Rhizopus microsporus]KAG1257923.1 hypothetical protein G6F68_009060 [Rhizopus microsporus]
MFGQRIFQQTGSIYLKRVDQQQETSKFQFSALGYKVDLRICCASVNETDDLNNIEFAKNINKDKYHVNYANHRKSFERGQNLASSRCIRRKEMFVKSVFLLERLMNFGERIMSNHDHFIMVANNDIAMDLW